MYMSPRIYIVPDIAKCLHWRHNERHVRIDTLGCKILCMLASVWGKTTLNTGALDIFENWLSLCNEHNIKCPFHTSILSQPCPSHAAYIQGNFTQYRDYRAQNSAPKWMFKPVQTIQSSPIHSKMWKFYWLFFVLFSELINFSYIQMNLENR